MSAADDAQAQAFLDEFRARAAFRATLARNLRGDPTAARELREDWLPIRLYQIERNARRPDADD